MLGLHVELPTIKPVVTVLVDVVAEIRGIDTEKDWPFGVKEADCDPAHSSDSVAAEYRSSDRS